MKKDGSDEKIKAYWEERANTAQLNTNATTDDVHLRELEIRTFIDTLKKIKKKDLHILDLGCGDGFTTLGIATELKNFTFLGVDYSANMIANASTRLKASAPSVQKRVTFNVADATRLPQMFKPGSFNVVISSRCLINLTTSKQQFKTIHDISALLKKNGYYISIENFEDGNNELNALRKSLGLSEIAVRWHNLFFNPKEYLKRTRSFFKTVEVNNFSSSYYYATRVIYAKYCEMIHVKPDYNHEIHQLAVHLPPAGNYSPIKLVIHKK